MRPPVGPRGRRGARSLGLRPPSEGRTHDRLPIVLALEERGAAIRSARPHRRSGRGPPSAGWQSSCRGGTRRRPSERRGWTGEGRGLARDRRPEMAAKAPLRPGSERRWSRGGRVSLIAHCASPTPELLSECSSTGERAKRWYGSAIPPCPEIGSSIKIDARRTVMSSAGERGAPRATPGVRLERRSALLDELARAPPAQPGAAWVGSSGRGRVQLLVRARVTRGAPGSPPGGDAPVRSSPGEESCASWLPGFSHTRSRGASL
jgi:hypothetical protein